jgi:hypothetical protein
LNAKETERVRQVVGCLLYYARAIDNTQLVTHGTIASEQAEGTDNTLRAVIDLLNYCATHPDAAIRYNASNMCLHVDSDASYLSASKARSRAAGYFYLSNMPINPNRGPSEYEAAPKNEWGRACLLPNLARNSLQRLGSRTSSPLS